MDWNKLQDFLSHRTPGLLDATGEFAVLIPVVDVEGEPHLIYEVRGAKLRSQPNEVCFPGGRMETGETPLQAALRETEEELGIPADQISVIGELDFVGHRSNFLLHPVVARVAPEALEHLALSPQEVAEIFLVPLRHLLDAPEEVYRCVITPQPEGDFSYEKLGMETTYRWRLGRDEVPVYRWENHVIWGLTGKVTRHFLRILREGGSL